MSYDKRTRSLVKKTLVLLANDKRTSLEICMETGLNFYWLKKFKKGEFKEPGANKVQFLWEHLTNKKLPV